jgi:hypothetical protein
MRALLQLAIHDAMHEITSLPAFLLSPKCSFRVDRVRAVATIIQLFSFNLENKIIFYFPIKKHFTIDFLIFPYINYILFFTLILFFFSLFYFYFLFICFLLSLALSIVFSVPLHTKTIYSIAFLFLNPRCKKLNSNIWCSLSNRTHLLQGFSNYSWKQGFGFQVHILLAFLPSEALSFFNSFSESGSEGRMVCIIIRSVQKN